MGHIKERKKICISMYEADIKNLDYLCDFLTKDFGFPVSRTKAINFLVKRYYHDVIGEKFNSYDEMAENQITLPLSP